MSRFLVSVIVRMTRRRAAHFVHGLIRERRDPCRSAYEVIRSGSGIWPEIMVVLIIAPEFGA
jgi:hypothetical protein